MMRREGILPSGSSFERPLIRKTARISAGAAFFLSAMDRAGFHRWLAATLAPLFPLKRRRPCPQGAIDVGKQYGYTDAAIRVALAEATRCRLPLYFSAGNYTYGDVLTLDGITAYGDGDASVLRTTNKPRMAIILRGSGPQLRALKITCPQCELPSGPPTSARLQTGESAGVFILPGTSGFVVDHVLVERAGSSGILNWGGHDGRITSNRVRNTLADGIHLTNAAYNVDVGWNYVENSGDDMYAVVSYGKDPGRSHDITIHDNRGIRQPWGRGIYLSGYNLKALRNNIQQTYGAAILMESGGFWNTWGVENAEVAGNYVRRPDQGNIHWANILIVAGSSATSHRMSNVYGSGNNLDCSTGKARVKVIGANVSGITVSGFCGA